MLFFAKKNTREKMKNETARFRLSNGLQLGYGLLRISHPDNTLEVNILITPFQDASICARSCPPHLHLQPNGLGILHRHRRFLESGVSLPLSATSFFFERQNVSS